MFGPVGRFGDVLALRSACVVWWEAQLVLFGVSDYLFIFL